MVDVSVTASGVLPESGAEIQSGYAGATITAGQALYKDSSDSNSLKPADADDTSAKATVVGIALNSASDGQPVDYQTRGNIDIGGTVTVGTVYVLSGTAGGICPAADLATGDYTSIIGVGVDADSIKLGILNSGVQVP